MFSLKPIQDRFHNTLFVNFFRKKIVSYTVISITFFIAVFFSMVTSLAPDQYELGVGQKAPIDLEAPRDLENKVATNLRIKKAIEAVEPREKVDPTIQIDVKKKIEKFFVSIYQIREMQDVPIAEKLGLLKEKNELQLKDHELMRMLQTPNEELENIESYIYEITMQVMSTGIKKEELEKEKINIENYFMGLKEFSDEIRLIGIHIVNSSIKANRFLDVETTQQKIEEAKNSIEKVIVKRGSVIVNEGDIITQEQLELLQDAGMTKEQGNTDFSLYMGIGISALVAEGLLIAYIYVFNRNLFSSISKLYLLLIIFLSTYFLSNTIFSISPYTVPVAAATMIIGILIDSRLAITVSFVMTILLAILHGNHVDFLIMSSIGGAVGGFGVTNTHQRSNIFIAGLLVSLSNVFVISGFGFINHYEWSKILIDGFYGILNGIFCAILTIGSLPLWESAFKILTPVKLLELSNPNQPILKKLLVEAPGTYHHSIIVGNLSEAAADAIGANGLFARVSAYYHDIGKLKRPYLFKENQLTSENPHDKMIASLSAMIITSHVKDGIEIGREYNLPQEIIEIIEQHHGTTLVKYFYHKAMNVEKNEKINEADYRYQGIKPQSREAAIVMLADSVEAAVRSMPEPTSDKIKHLIDKIIEDKLQDQQLDECNITLKDIHKIASTFRTVLLGIFHERIEYPELNTQKVEEVK
ncbi:HDIG domain-containing protein [Clostridiaceae bacterium 35-E11]